MGRAALHVALLPRHRFLCLLLYLDRVQSERGRRQYAEVGRIYSRHAAGLRMLAGAGVKKLSLAGAFGNYIRQASARTIGLLPEDLPVEPVGNSSLRGARTLLLAPGTRQARLQEIAALTRHIELAGDPNFQYLFAEMMSLARYRLTG